MADIKSKKAATTAKYKTSAPAQRSGESSYAYSQRLAKMVDTRLRRLEELSKQKGYENVKGYAYANAMKDIQGLFGGGTTFQRRAKKTKAGQYNEKQVQAQISAAKRFLEAPTSTKRGINRIYKNRANSLNEKYGTNFTWEELGQFFSSGLAEKLDANYASKTAMRSIGTIQKNEFKTVQDIDEYAKTHKISADQEVVLDAARKMISENGKDIEKLFFN